MADGDTDGQTTEYVPVHEASNEDLDSFLDRDENFDGENNTESPEENEQASKPEEVKADTKEAEEKPEFVSKAELDKVLAELQKTKKHSESQSAFINRQANELGETRKQLAATRERKIQHFNDGVENGELSELERAELSASIVQDAREIQNIDAAAQNLNHINTNLGVAKHYFQDQDYPIEEVAKMMEEDGIPQEGIAAFKANPYGSYPTTAFINLGLRVKERRAKEEVISDARTLAGYIKQLQAENATLKGKPNQVLKNISQATSKSNSVNGGNGGTAQPRRSNITNVSELSMADLDSIIEAER